MPATVPVDPTALAGWADGVLPGDGPLDVQPLGDGHSNLTFLVRRAAGGPSWVLRRPPMGPLLPTAHDVLREYRVLDLLGRATTPVRVPVVVAVCDDESVLGAPFYLMEQTPGVVVRAELPDWLAADADAQHALGLDLVDALAEIHLADWEPFVEAGIGKPGGYLARQLRRWSGQREGIQTAVAAAGGQARELPDYDVMRDWLADHLPDEAAPGIVHGDYKLDNVIVQRGTRGTQGPRVATVIDWEMATVGDPRADLGYLLSFWPEPGAEPDSQPLMGQLVVLGSGFPTREELIAQWADRTGRDPGDTAWFIALAIWKLAVLLEASYHRWLAGTAHDPFFATLDVGVPALLARARTVAGA